MIPDSVDTDPSELVVVQVAVYSEVAAEALTEDVPVDDDSAEDCCEDDSLVED